MLNQLVILEEKNISKMTFYHYDFPAKIAL
jgi:hypothetical protein